MKEFIDKTSEKSGTKINREALMGIQGFQEFTIDFDEKNDIITETYANGEKFITSFNDDGSISETLVGEKTITETTIFEDDGTIRGVLS